MSKKTLDAVSLLLDGCRGIYIPRDFCQDFKLELWGLSSEDEDVKVCLDSDHEWYWDAWSDIMDKAQFTENGHTWTLYQDGDLWALCPELMTDEEKRNFGFEVE